VELVISMRRRLNRARAYAGGLLVALGSLALLTKNGVFILLIFVNLIAYAAWPMGRKGSRVQIPSPRLVLSGVLVLAFVRWLSIFSQRALSRPVSRDSKSTRAARSLAACQSAGRQLKLRSGSHTKITRRKDHGGVGIGKC